MRRILLGGLLVVFGIIVGMSMSAVSVASDPEVTILQKQVIELDRRLQSLESAIRVQTGSVTIQSPTITLEGTSINIRASGSLTMKGAKIINN